MVILPWLFCKVYLMFLQSSVMISGDVFVGGDGLSFYFFIFIFLIQLLHFPTPYNEVFKNQFILEDLTCLPPRIPKAYNMPGQWCIFFC